MGGDPKVLAVLDEVRANHVIRWLDAAEWPARDEVTQLAVRGWFGSLEEIALASTTSPVPRDSVVELLVEGLIADLDRADRSGCQGMGQWGMPDQEHVVGVPLRRLPGWLKGFAARHGAWSARSR